MKKAILSPLCSALVIPGLGQVINQQLKKGLLMLGTVFVLLIVFTVRFVQVIQAVLGSSRIMPSDSSVMIDRIKGQDPWVFYVLLAVFGAVWAYSVIDAFLGGMEQDRAALIPDPGDRP